MAIAAKKYSLISGKTATENALQYAAISFMFTSNPKLNADSFKKFFVYCLLPAAGELHVWNENMNQPIPEVTENDVIRIIQRDFPTKQFDTVMSILSIYGNFNYGQNF